jgi:hypothetical protein
MAEFSKQLIPDRPKVADSASNSPRAARSAAYSTSIWPREFVDQFAGRNLNRDRAARGWSSPSTKPAATETFV